MAENMYNANHKATNEKYRKEYDRIFKKKKRSKPRPKQSWGNMK